VQEFVRHARPERGFNCNQYSHLQARCMNMIACGICAGQRPKTATPYQGEWKGNPPKRAGSATGCGVRPRAQNEEACQSSSE
jgi:hypothetical protein